MRKRLLKKRHLGTYRTWAIEARFTALGANGPGSACDALWDRLFDYVDAQGTSLAGSSALTPSGLGVTFDVIFSRSPAGGPREWSRARHSRRGGWWLRGGGPVFTEADRAGIKAFLEALPAIDVAVGPLVDAWHGRFEFLDGYLEAPMPSLPTPSLPTPSLPTPSLPTPSLPTPSLPTPGLPN